MAPDRARGGQAAWWAVGVLAVRNVAGAALPGWAYVPTNIATGAALVGLARRADTGWEALGLGHRHLGRGIRWGSVLGAAAVIAMAVGAVLPVTQGFFDDDRVEVDRGNGELAYQTLLRIPVGTVVFEEVAFRAVLLALLRRRMESRRAILVESALFGLWHVTPTLSTASINGIEGLSRVGLVAGSVAATATGGVVFSVLRLRAGHVVAPALVHLAFNDAGYAFSWLLRT